MKIGSEIRQRPVAPFATSSRRHNQRPTSYPARFSLASTQMVISIPYQRRLSRGILWSSYEEFTHAGPSAKAVEFLRMEQEQINVTIRQEILELGRWLQIQAMEKLFVFNQIGHFAYGRTKEQLYSLPEIRENQYQQRAK